MMLVRAALDLMGHADRQRLSELRGLTHEQIRRRIADDHELRASLRRAIAPAIRPTEQPAAGGGSQGDSVR